MGGGMGQMAIWDTVIEGMMRAADTGFTALFNKKEAKRQRNFAEAVGKNKIRWMVNDMKRAGINPLVAFPGSGAIGGGVPGGSAASISRDTGSVMRSGAEATRAKADARLKAAGIAVQEETAKQLIQQQDATRATAHREREQAGLAFQQRMESRNRTEYMKHLSESERFNAELNRLKIPGARNQAKADQAPEAEHLRRGGNIGREVGRIFGRSK